ncbi:MAG: ATP-binding protein [Nitrospirota bacterium]|nr:ATP-binding protein [Nitrospirota bacterium]
MKFALPEIRHNLAGFEELVHLHRELENCRFVTVEIDMTSADWFDADMCAPFGAILYRLGQLGNQVHLTNVRPGVEKILSKNGFLSHYGRMLLPDTYGTTIPYQRFDVKDDRFFASYVESRFVQRSEMPRMSPGLVKRFREGVFEIFSNAVIHSQTQLGIFSCGQFFPKRNRLDFSVADLGIGIQRNVKEHTGVDLPAHEAIEWATQAHNTTKRGQIPGGLGLKLLSEFITLNGGRMQIVSDSGYWSLEKDQTQIMLLPRPFPGTVVSVEINTSDTQSYALSSELTDSDIF